jgi:hypothetical protein
VRTYRLVIDVEVPDHLVSDQPWDVMNAVENVIDVNTDYSAWPVSVDGEELPTY